jgi:hypothetical protein
MHDDQLSRLHEMFGDYSRHPVRFGTVVDVDTTNGLVKVEIEPEGESTDFIKYVGLGAAFGPWQALLLPPNGAEVLLLAADPDCRTYVAVGTVYTLNDGPSTPPTGYAAGQVLLQHRSSGNQLLLDADGTIYLGAKSGAQPVVMQPWITDTFNPHTHPHPMGPTGPVTLAWSSGDVSTKFKGV